MDKRRQFLLALLVVAATLAPGCNSNRSQHHHNPDGSYSYYRFNNDHTRECTCRNVYHPSSHYYHAHY